MLPPVFGAVVRSLVGGLRFERASRFPERGLGTGNAFDELYQQFDRIGGTHLIVCDEIDHLEDANTLLYELPRASERSHLSIDEVRIVALSSLRFFVTLLSVSRGSRHGC
ncbi:orc1/cdc6 family replication initiation protein [Halorubrum distributum JCM 13916]|uniref:Orc1/cdc6 family replication initiation protein n=1 Tax=Halorubrum distributum JCM 13916 TaxID=1230455 RepID=M0PMC1_9EURY|nr:hypothetical protein [Halorubrum arcis]EMA71053.1 orc1/cdc6 family replication initiation protein [Halorubrum arcis JCM 13916]